MQMLAVQTDD